MISFIHQQNNLIVLTFHASIFSSLSLVTVKQLKQNKTKKSYTHYIYDN